MKKIISYAFGFAAAMCFTACESRGGFMALSSPEASLLNGGNPFEEVEPFPTPTPTPTPFDPDSKQSGVDDLKDAHIPNLSVAATNPPKFVVRCDPATYAAERQAALDAAKNDPERKTIPVAFSVSMGTAFDDLAHYAHRRSILRVDSDMKTPVYVGPAHQYVYAGASAFHYITDHSVARDNFIHGKRCFFDTIRIVDKKVGEVLDENGKANHGYRIFHYGAIYDAKDPKVIAGQVSPRLFERVETADYTKKDPQFINLYVVDLREKALESAAIDAELLDTDFKSSAKRSFEYSKTFRELLNLPNFWRYRDAITKVLSTNRMLTRDTGAIADANTLAKNKFAYSAYEGMPQVIDWLVFSGLSATVISTQYTPIVLDLGDRNIKTSSVDWGTFFNLANLKRNDVTDPIAARKVSHLTAWVGGNVVESADANDVSKYYFQRRAEDGFLVVPSADGKINGVENLLGSATPVDGKTFDDGFKALVALSGKKCESKEIKDRYIGPWDAELYSAKLKVWTDVNRNGVADAGEIQSLAEAGIGALNACNKVHQQDKDKFGNSTSLRATFLLMDRGEDASTMSDEILARLKNGKSAAGKEGDFRVMIDVFFKTRPDFYLENIDPAKIVP